MFDPDRYEQIVSPSDHAFVMRDIATRDAPTKNTAHNRFLNLDKELVKILIGSEMELSVHDMSVSNGTTSVELLKTLSKNGLNIDMTISDKYSGLTAINYNWFTDIYFDDRGNYYGSRFLRFLFYYEANFIPRTDLEHKPAKCIGLLHSSVNKLIDLNHLKFIYYDVFETKPDITFDVVRCMNLLNFSYFSEAQIVNGIRNIMSSVKEGGLFVVGRTNVDINNATIYQKRNGDLICIKTIGVGTEIDSLISVANRYEDEF